ncbi:hypothetical protein [Acidicapsa dinghuensis]|nr:hypothetical protein [Acidicapsa dinghuensis]
MQNQILELLSARRGHFLFESGHHGSLWLYLELLCLQPARIRPLAQALAARLANLEFDYICGPFVEGAFIALTIAEELGKEFLYTERHAQPSADGLFPAGHHLPDQLRARVRNKRIAIINDVTNAGSAVRGTYNHLESCGSQVIAIGSLVVLGSAASDFAASKGIPLETLAAIPNDIWPHRPVPTALPVPRWKIRADFAKLLAEPVAINALLLRQRHIRPQISNQRPHLLLSKSPGKARHLPFSRQHGLCHTLIRRNRPARHFPLAHHSLQLRRRRFQPQIIILMTMRASHHIEMLPFRLLRREFRLSAATHRNKYKGSKDRESCCPSPTQFPSRMEKPQGSSFLFCVSKLTLRQQT